jgi:hypothetical protein
MTPSIMNPQSTPTISSSAPSLASSSGPPSARHSRDSATASTRGKKGAWLTNKAHKLAGWLATSEPSAQAFHQHRKESFQKAGISQKEEEPHAKLHAPLGGIPSDAIHPSTGPRPEELLQKKAREWGARKQKHLKGSMSSTGPSLYSG